MPYDCDDCDWSSGDDSPGEAMPEYLVSDGTQVAHCPECWSILDTRENNLAETLGARF